MSLMLTEVQPADDRIRPSGKGEAPKDSTGQRATVRASPGQRPCPARRKESVGMRATRQATRGHAPRPLSVVAVLACCALTVGGSTALGQGIGATRWLALSPAFWSVLGIAMGIAHPDSSTFTGTMG